VTTLGRVVGRSRTAFSTARTSGDVRLCRGIGSGRTPGLAPLGTPRKESFE
jgi:hypothetical protein